MRHNKMQQICTFQLTRGSVTTHFRCDGQCYTLFWCKFNQLFSSERL